MVWTSDRVYLILFDCLGRAGHVYGDEVHDEGWEEKWIVSRRWKTILWSFQFDLQTISQTDNEVNEKPTELSAPYIASDYNNGRRCNWSG